MRSLLYLLASSLSWDCRCVRPGEEPSDPELSARGCDGLVSCGRLHFFSGTVSTPSSCVTWRNLRPSDFNVALRHLYFSRPPRLNGVGLPFPVLKSYKSPFCFYESPQRYDPGWRFFISSPIRFASGLGLPFFRDSARGRDSGLVLPHSFFRGLAACLRPLSPSPPRLACKVFGSLFSLLFPPCSHREMEMVRSARLIPSGFPNCSPSHDECSRFFFPQAQSTENCIFCQGSTSLTSCWIFVFLPGDCFPTVSSPPPAPSRPPCLSPFPGIGGYACAILPPNVCVVLCLQSLFFVFYSVFSLFLVSPFVTFPCAAP